MRRYYSWSDVLVLREDLQALAWSEPMRDLAAKLEMSDVGLKKLLASHGVAPPPQGYWNKLRAGKPVPKPPATQARRPGEIGRVRVDHRFTKVLPPIEPLPSSGPFATKFVPENVEEILTAELAAIGRVRVSGKLDRVHRGLAALIKQEQRRREKAAASHWHWDNPKFESPLAKRRLRILNSVLMTLSRRGNDGEISDRDGDLECSAIVGDTTVPFSLAATAGGASSRGYGRVEGNAQLPANTPLVLQIIKPSALTPCTAWKDDKAGLVETKIASIVAGLIAAGEANFRQGLREAEARAEQFRIAEEKRRQEEVAARNRERLEHLRRSGDLLRQAEEIRKVIGRVREAMLSGDVPVDSAALLEWERWAHAEADRLDPIKSGQVLNHLRPSAKTGSDRSTATPRPLSFQSHRDPARHSVSSIEDDRAGLDRIAHLSLYWKIADAPW